MRYRRNFVPGGSYFFTVVTRHRKPILTSANSVDVLREAFARVRRHYPFTVEAIVILPDHLHCIWTLPPGDADFSTKWRLVKTAFTKACHPNLREQGVWQQRYWEHTLRDETDFRRHVDYIHYNPVKHGYVGQVKDWPYSSFHRSVAAGLYSENWGSDVMDFAGIGME